METTIAIVAVLVVAAYAGWILHELVHAPVVDEDGKTLKKDKEETK